MKDLLTDLPKSLFRSLHQAYPELTSVLRMKSMFRIEADYNHPITYSGGKNGKPFAEHYHFPPAS